MDFEERLLAYWEADRQQSSAQWIKGDLLLDLEDESLKEFSEHVSDSYQTLKKYRWMASRYDQVLRRTDLFYSHHELVAARDDREEWLKKAAEQHWSVRQMEREILHANVEEARREKIKSIAQDSSQPGEFVQRVFEAFKDTIDRGTPKPVGVYMSKDQAELDYLNQAVRGVLQEYFPEQDP
jgi:hypothetical protein